MGLVLTARLAGMRHATPPAMTNTTATPTKTLGSIARRPEEHRFDRAHQDQGAEHAHGEADHQQADPLREDQTEDRYRLTPQRHPEADLRAPLYQQVGHHPVDPA